MVKLHPINSVKLCAFCGESEMKDCIFSTSFGFIELKIYEVKLAEVIGVKRSYRGLKRKSIIIMQCQRSEGSECPSIRLQDSLHCLE